MWGHTVLVTEDSSIKLGALLISEMSYTMPSLSFFDKEDAVIEIWENESFLYEFYQKLKQEPCDFSEIEFMINEEEESLITIQKIVLRKENILELFETGIKLGFFNNVIIKKSEN